MLTELSTAFYDVMFGEVDASVSMNVLERKTLQKVRAILNDPDKLGENIPTLPAMLVRLLSTLKDPHSDVFSFIEIIEQDPSFAVEVLRVANSARYRKGDNEIISLRRAISLLGLAGVSRIATTLLMAEMIPCNPIYYKMFGRQIWLHSVQCAAFCELLAEDEKTDVFDAYFLGLVHDIGKIIIFDCLSESLGEVLISCLPGTKVYIELLTEMSMDISYFIAKEWQLPNVYIEALDQMRKEEREPLADLLYKADKFCEIYLMQQKGKVTADELSEYFNFFSVDELIWIDFIELAPSIESSVAL